MSCLQEAGGLREHLSYFLSSGAKYLTQVRRGEAFLNSQFIEISIRSWLAPRKADKAEKPTIAWQARAAKQKHQSYLSFPVIQIRLRAYWLVPSTPEGEFSLYPHPEL